MEFDAADGEIGADRITKGRTILGVPLWAEAEYEAALRVNPNLANVKVWLGLLYFKTVQQAEAVRLARELEQTDPKSAAPLLLRGIALLAQNDPQGAFSAALKIKLDLLDALRGLGAFQQLGRIDRAEEGYREALAPQQQGSRLPEQSGLDSGRAAEEAGRSTTLAIEADQLAPASSEVLDTLGWVQYRRGSYADAEKALSRAAEKAPNNGTIEYHLGMPYAKLGERTTLYPRSAAPPSSIPSWPWARRSSS